MGGDGSGPDPVAVAWARWSAAEERLYPQVMMDPETYERAVRAVGAVAGALRERARTADELVALEAEPEELLAAVSAERAAAPELSDRLLLEAACALRYRELTGSGGGWGA